jgi:hypothetical protein
MCSYTHPQNVDRVTAVTSCSRPIFIMCIWSGIMRDIHCILVCRHVEVSETSTDLKEWRYFASSPCLECISERSVQHITHTALSLVVQHEIVANFRHWGECYINNVPHQLEEKPATNIRSNRPACGTIPNCLLFVRRRYLFIRNPSDSQPMQQSLCWETDRPVIRFVNKFLIVWNPRVRAVFRTALRQSAESSSHVNAQFI